MRTKYLLLVGLAALLGSCQNENEPKTSSVPERKFFRIIIEGDGLILPPCRRKKLRRWNSFREGLYDGDGRTNVTATPNSDYEIDYFWGGPASDPDKYTTSSTAATTYDVRIGGEDHTFHLNSRRRRNGK